MTYLLFLAELCRFGLISEEQAQEAYREYQQGIADHERRMEAFREEWQAEYDKRPWWRRWLSLETRETSWVRDWYAKDIDERFPPSEEDLALRRLFEEAG